MARKSNIGKSLARAGGWGKKVRRKKAGKKRAKKAGKKRGKKRAKKGRKKSAKRRTRVNRPKVRNVTRKPRKRRKKGAKRRATTTTFKTSGVKMKMKCGPGRVAKATSYKGVSRSGVTHIAMGGRCIKLGSGR